VRALVCVAVIALTACSKPATPPATTGSPANPVQNESVTTTVQVSSGPRLTMPDGAVYALEVVADEEQRAQGLMFRDQLRPNTGMLFVFPSDGEYSFWMKNTLIPLDMIWIDTSQTIVHIKRDVPPCKIENCPSYGPGVQSRYVLELAAGEAAKHNLKVGDRLVFAGTEEFLPR
jgi:uncharacterized membrane protein (UPF0127 family)